MGIREDHALRREGSRNAAWRSFPRVEAFHIAVTEVIAEDEDDVGFGRPEQAADDKQGGGGAKGGAWWAP